MLVMPASASYLWNNGQTTQQIYAHNSGNILVWLLQQMDVAYTDTVFVNVLPNPVRLLRQMTYNIM